MTTINFNYSGISPDGPEKPVKTGSAGGAQVQNVVVGQSNTGNIGDALVISQQKMEETGTTAEERDWTQISNDEVINKVIQEGLESITESGGKLSDHPAVTTFIGDYCENASTRDSINASIKAFREGLKASFDAGEITDAMKKEYDANLDNLEKTLIKEYKQYKKTKHVPQHYALKFGTAPKIEKSQMNNVMETYLARLQGATSEEREEVLAQIANMYNNGSIPADAVAKLLDDFSRSLRGNGGKGVIVTRKYGEIESDLKEFVTKIDSKKKHELIVAYLDTASDTMDSCYQLFGRDSSKEIQKRRELAISNNEKLEGRYTGDPAPKMDDGCETISDRIIKNRCAEGSQNQNK